MCGLISALTVSCVCVVVPGIGSCTGIDTCTGRCMYIDIDVGFVVRICIGWRAYLNCHCRWR